MLPFLYRLAWSAARPFAAPLALAGGKLGRAIQGRRAAVPTLAAWAARERHAAAPLVWFHAASVGEGRQAEAVLRPLKAARPAWQLAYTHSSPSAERLAAALPVDVAAYAPFDTVRDARAALDALRPAAIVPSVDVRDLGTAGPGSYLRPVTVGGLGEGLTADVRPPSVRVTLARRAPPAPPPP